MVASAILNGTTPRAQAPLQNHPKSPQSAPDSHRRHSLPHHFLPPSLWSANTSTASLIESEAAARGEHIYDEATAAHRISALRQLNGATPSRHRYAKSTGARSSTFNSPVIVRTYSGAARPRSIQRSIVSVKKESGLLAMAAGKMEMKMPPVEAFTFKGIMEEIKHGVAEDLERIAEICARSRYSLSNQYEVHMPPHGRGEPIPPLLGLGMGPPNNIGGPTLQAISSDDEQIRPVGRGSRGGRRTKSVAYGTLETIMSSSRSSDEDKTKKKPAAVLAEEVRGRQVKKEREKKAGEDAAEQGTTQAGPVTGSHSRHVRSKSASFAAMVIDNAQSVKQDSISQLMSPISLISEPARPQTSTTTDMDNISLLQADQSPTMHSFMSRQPTLIRNESMASTLKPESDRKPSLLGGLGSWLPWAMNSPSNNQTQGRMRSASHAEGSLRELLKATDVDRKGKGVDRSG